MGSGVVEICVLQVSRQALLREGLRTLFTELNARGVRQGNPQLIRKSWGTVSQVGSLHLGTKI